MCRYRCIGKQLDLREGCKVGLYKYKPNKSILVNNYGN